MFPSSWRPRSGQPSGIGHGIPSKHQGAFAPATATTAHRFRCMVSNARERALALVFVLKSTNLVPCRVLADLLAKMGTAPCVDARRNDAAAEVGRLAHPDGWTTKALAEYYDCGISTMRGRIEAGEFGPPESEGGPCKAGPSDGLFRPIRCSRVMRAFRVVLPSQSTPCPRIVPRSAVAPRRRSRWG